MDVEALADRAVRRASLPLGLRVSLAVPVGACMLDFVYAVDRAVARAGMRKEALTHYKTSNGWLCIYVDMLKPKSRSWSLSIRST